MMRKPLKISLFRTLGWLCALLALIAFAGCAKKAVHDARHLEGDRTREAVAIERNLLSVRKASQQFTGLARMQLITAGEDRRTDAAVAIIRPDNIRVDAMDALADVWAQAGSDGSHLWLFIPAKHKLYEGRASSRTMRRLAKFDWNPNDIVSIIAGTPPLGAAPLIVQLAPHRDDHFIDQQSGLHLWTGEEKGRVSRCIRYADDGTSVDYRVSFSDYRREQGVHFPHRIELEFPGRGAKIQVQYDEITLGGSVDRTSFLSPKARAKKRVQVDR